MEYQKKCNEQLVKNSDSLIEHVKRDTCICEIIYNINEKVLDKYILRYIAPHFGINLKLIEIEKTMCSKCKKNFDKDKGDFFKTKFYCNACAEKIFNDN